MLPNILCIAGGFISGSIPFSLLLGRLVSSKDIRTVGDGNPGAANAWKAGGWRSGLPAMILDISKGFLPVYLAVHVGHLEGWALLPIALAPILGHAFSPLLRFKGGKAIGVSGGVWLALAGLEPIVVFGVFTLVMLVFQPEHAWCVVVGMSCLAFYWIVAQADLPLTLTAAGNLLILAWKHRHELLRPILLRQWVKNLLLRARSS